MNGRSSVGTVRIPRCAQDNDGHGRRYLRVRARRTALAALLMTWPTVLWAQQVADTLFAPKVAAPAYARAAGPVVLLDEAHTNFHTLDGRYLTFGRLLAQDGFIVRPNRSRFTRALLDSARVLVIANALNGANARAWRLPTPSAFDPTEIRAVRDWVRAGGSLLLIADHMPFPGAAGALAEALGVRLRNGFVYDSALKSGNMRFRRGDGSLADHAITNGRNAAERVDSVTAFMGEAFRLEVPGSALLTLARGTVLLSPEEAWVFSDRTPREPASGMLQGAALRVGRGRVAVFGEAAMFSAQVTGAARSPMGMNAPGAEQNAQFLLNIMHWLTGLIGEG